MPNVAPEQLGQEQILVLYAVNKSPDGIPTKTHYQTIMFLILKALGHKPGLDAGYRPHHFGPYSDPVGSWRDELIIAGYLTKGKNSERIKISPEAQEIVDGMTVESELNGLKIKEIVEFVCSLNNDELLLFVYADDLQKKESMSSNSTVRDDVFKRRVEMALGMAKKGKVSVARGAELADMDVKTFMTMLNGKS